VISDDELLAWIGEIAARTAEVAERVGPGAEIEGCPDWTADDLIAHVAPLYPGWYSYNLTMGMADADLVASRSSAPPLPDDFGARLDYLRRGADAFLAKASAADLDVGVWMWDKEVPARTWVTRTATEMGVHCWDLERSIDEVRRVSGPRGAVSVEEHHQAMLRMLVWSQRVMPGRFHHPPIPDEPIGIEVTDGDAAWVLAADGTTVSFASSRDLPPTSVHGSGHDLMLYQYGRVPLAALEVRGDSDLLTAWNWWARDIYEPIG
jgi:hypothetical protein